MDPEDGGALEGPSQPCFQQWIRDGTIERVLITLAADSKQGEPGHREAWPWTSVTVFLSPEGSPVLRRMKSGRTRLSSSASSPSSRSASPRPDPAWAGTHSAQKRSGATDADDLEGAEVILRSAPAATEVHYLSDRIVLPALRHLAGDRSRGTLDPDRAGELRVAFADLLDDLGEKRTGTPRLEADAAAVPADVLVNIQAERAAASGSEAICISALTPASEVRARYLCKRLARHGSTQQILVGAWASAEARSMDRSSAAAAGRPRRISHIAEAFDRLGESSQPRPDPAAPPSRKSSAARPVDG